MKTTSPFETSGLHTVLGASGASGIALVKELKKRELKIRAVQRSVCSIEGIETAQANLLDSKETSNAINGSSYVYMCAAVEYKTSSWQSNWPLMMKNTIEACLQNNAVLIFLDNIYMYGPSPLTVPFDERHSQFPPSKKGQVRKHVANMVLEAVNEKKLKAVIARSADFYGPNAKNSMFYISTLDRMLEGKGPQSIAKPGILHTFANTTDNATAMVSLALDPTTYGQVWHLPVGKPIKPEELISMINKELGKDYKISFLPPFMRRVLSLFIPALKETEEMLYQFENDYVMSWEKLKKQFPELEATSYPEGIREMIASFR